MGTGAPADPPVTGNVTCPLDQGAGTGARARLRGRPRGVCTRDQLCTGGLGTAAGPSGRGWASSDRSKARTGQNTRDRRRTRWTSCRLPSPPLVLPPDLSGTLAADSESRATSLQTAPGPRLCGAPASRRQTPGPVRAHRGGGRGLLVSKSISHALSGHTAGADALTSQGPFPQGAPTCTVRASRRARR